jgi:hypothetical protein
MRCSMGLEDVLTFVKLLNKFRDVERKLVFAKENRRENDAEHSYQWRWLHGTLFMIKNWIWM